MIREIYIFATLICRAGGKMPQVFPTHHILTVVCLASLAYLLLHFGYTLFKKKNAYNNPKEADRTSWFLVGWLLVAALVIRIILSVQLVGHRIDIALFTRWGNDISTNGFRSFYTAGQRLPDYPPGYMYILGLMSKLSKALDHPQFAADGSYDHVYVILTKLPAILADLGAALFTFFIARKKYRFAPSFMLMAIVAFCPVMAYISGGWGQIDQVLALFLCLSFLSLNYNLPILGGVFYGLAIVFKPQALMIGPLLALAYILYILDGNSGKLPNSGKKIDPGWLPRFGKTCAAVGIAVFLIALSAAPFSSAEYPWYQILIDKYFGTATSYKYASVNAYNTFALFGLNWKPIADSAGHLNTYGILGYVGMGLSIAAGLLLYFFTRPKNKGSIYLAGAFTLLSIFMFGHYMHERYLFPALLMLVVAYIHYSDRRLLGVFFGFTVTTLLNCIAAFYYSEEAYFKAGLYWDEKLVFWCSLINLLLFVYFVYVCVTLALSKGKTKDVFRRGKDDSVNGFTDFDPNAVFVPSAKA